MSLPTASWNTQYYLQAGYELACAVASAEMALFAEAFAVQSFWGIVFAVLCRSFPVVIFRRQQRREHSPQPLAMWVVWLESSTPLIFWLCNLQGQLRGEITVVSQFFQEEKLNDWLVVVTGLGDRYIFCSCSYLWLT
jgi:hypothetical protein